MPGLRIDGFIAGKLAASRKFSSDLSKDALGLHADDAELQADGIDCTRLAFAVVDAFGNPRLHATGEVQLSTDGPEVLVGDNPFNLEPSGGLGTVWMDPHHSRPPR